MEGSLEEVTWLKHKTSKMIKEVINPIGLNATVHRIQVAMHNAFDVAWSDKNGLGEKTEDGIVCYPICFINFKRSNQNITYNKKIIEHFDYYSESDLANMPIGGGNDYKDILDADENKMIVLSEYEIEPVGINYETTRLELIFILDLSRAYSDIVQRQAAVEQVRVDVIKVIERIPNVSLHKTVRGLNRVFGELEYSSSLDLHPQHCFKATITVDRFSKDDKICKI